MSLSLNSNPSLSFAAINESTTMVAKSSFSLIIGVLIPRTTVPTHLIFITPYINISVLLKKSNNLYILYSFNYLYVKIIFHLSKNFAMKNVYFIHILLKNLI